MTMMNANIPKIRDIKKLTRYHRKMIVGTVLRPEDSYPKRAERLKKLSFVDDDVKFQVLKESDLVSQDLYDTLYALYFGETVPEKANAAENAANAAKIDENAAENAAAEEVHTESVAEKTDEPAEKTEKKRNYPQKLTEEQTLELINLHLSGADNAEIAERFGRTPKQITQKLADLKRRGKYMHLFAEKEKKPEPICGTAAASEDILSIFDIPKTYRARGRGYITTEGRIRIDDEPITAALCKAMRDKGIVQTYAEVEVIVRVTEPAGMVVTEE